MATGAPKPGGYKNPAPGGNRQPTPGGVTFAGGNWRAYSGHAAVDADGPLSASGARVAQTRSVKNIRRTAKTSNVTYAWTLPTRPGGSTATVTSGAATATATFTPDAAGLFVFRCVVTFVGEGSVTIDFAYTSA